MALPDIAGDFLKLVTDLSEDLRQMDFQEAEVLYPIYYASDLHSQFTRKYLTTPKNALFLGINPGLHSSCQTGIPFGDVDTVRNWFDFTTGVDAWRVEQGRYRAPNLTSMVRGLTYSYDGEESGRRFFCAVKEFFGTPNNFFKSCFVYNYCPVGIFDRARRPLTPEDLHRHSRIELENLCDFTLGKIIDLLNVQSIIAVGNYPKARARAVLNKIRRGNITIVDSMIHPSPKNDESFSENHDSWEEYAQFAFRFFYDQGVF